MIRRHIAAIAILLAAHGHLFAEDTKAVERVEFQRDIAPLIVEKCLDCHGPNMQLAEFRMDRKDLAFESGEAGGSIEAGSADNSYLIQRLHDRDEGILMPPTGQLSEPEQALFRQWIDQGAEWPDGVQLGSASRRTADASYDAIYRAIRNNEPDAVKTNLASATETVSQTDRYGATLLMYAALHGNADIVKHLLDHGADPNFADPDGATALLWGARSEPIVKLLLEHDANAAVKSKRGTSALTVAASFADNGDTAGRLIDAGADVTLPAVLRAAVVSGDSGMVRQLIEAGAKPGNLRMAAFLNDQELVRMLVQRDPAQPDLNRALKEAAIHGERGIVELLLESGANPSAKLGETNGASPLMAAAYSEYQDPHVIQLLLDRGADPTIRDSKDRTALSYALMQTRQGVVDQLMQAKPVVEREVTEDAVRDSATKSLALLQSCGTTFFRNSGCVACHQHSLTSLAVEQAHRTGIKYDVEAAREQLQLTAMVQAGRRAQFLQRRGTGGAGHTIGYLLLGMAAESYPADKITDASAYELSGMQRQDGSWYSHAHRPPTEYSSVSATAVAVKSLQAYAPPSMKERVSAQVRQAREWLIAKSPRYNQEHAFRLLGLRWTNARSESLAPATDALLRLQQPDGGWAQRDGMLSDAHATGLALYALHVGGGLPTTDSAYRHGLRYLLSTQRDDGSWHVRGRAYKFQPYFESGFPYHHDQWISTAATGWAATALMLSL